jgi:hypothetical protein
MNIWDDCRLDNQEFTARSLYWVLAQTKSVFPKYGISLCVCSLTDITGTYQMKCHSGILDASHYRSMV